MANRLSEAKILPISVADSPMCKHALLLAGSGLFVFPVWNLRPDLSCACPLGADCGSPGKHPLVKTGLKVATTDSVEIRKWWKRHPQANIGVNADMSGLIIVDIDPRNGGNESLQKLEAEHGELPATYEVITGGQGKHYYYRHTPVVKSKPISPGVDIKSRGGYVVGHGSLHHSGRAYEAMLHGDPRGLIQDAPGWLVGLCTAADKSVGEPGGKDSDSRDNTKSSGKGVRVSAGLLGLAFQHAGWIQDGDATGKVAARCPFESEHTSGTAFDGSCVVFAPENGGINGFVQCSHSHCAERKQSEYWDACPEVSRDHARSVLSVSRLYEPAANTEPGWLTSWRSSLLFDNKGKLKRVLANASLILKNHPDFIGCLGYDEFKETYHWLRVPPAIMGMNSVTLGPVRDEHFVQIGYYLAAKYDMQEFSSDNIFQIMRAAAVPFHPVRQYLDKLEWDQTPRIMKWLTTYLGVPPTPYASMVGAWWMVSAVARILVPGCKADHVLILEGKQGTQKSTALRVLFNPWFADTPINLDSKDAYTALRGVWGYELQELQSLSKADSDKAKAFFSSPVDIYRKPYDRTTVEILRQCVFCGTVNYDAYLKDGSGNRRYWPVVTDQIRIELLEHDKDQLWAEALHLYNLGFAWYPTTNENHDMCAAEQDQRLQLDEDPWEPAVVAIVAGIESITVSEILSDPVHFGHCKRDIKDAIRVAKILRGLGWTKHVTASGKKWKKPVDVLNPVTKEILA